MTTVRDVLVRRKAWVLAIQGVCYFFALLVLPVAVRMDSLGWQTRLSIAVIGVAALFVLMFKSSRWVRCPVCDCNLTRFSLRRKGRAQVNFCVHCGLELDAPTAAGASR